MQIPVLIMLPGQEPLRESAMAFQSGRMPAFPITAAKVPRTFSFDPASVAIPVGSGRPADAISSLDPNRSDLFAVAGAVEAAALEDVPAELEGARIFVNPRISAFPATCGGAPPIGSEATVRQKLQAAQLAARGLDGQGVAIAILDTGINRNHVQNRLGQAVLLDAANSWSPPGVGIPAGNHPVDHGTMCAYDSLLMAPRATLLDYPILASNVPGGSAAGGMLSVALLAYSNLIASWAVAFASGGAARYTGLVVSNSWGIYHPSWDFPAGHPGRFIDNPGHPFNLVVSVLAAAGADIVFAAGNCGSDCPDGRCEGRTTEAIMGCNALQDVLTLAGCDTNDLRVGYSSQGPSIAGMFQQKPDVTAYAHFLGSEAFGPGSPDSGTSTACPVAAGAIAALRTRLSPATVPPSALFAQLRSTARPVPGPAGWNPDYGFGIIDPFSAATSLGL